MGTHSPGGQELAKTIGPVLSDREKVPYFKEILNQDDLFGRRSMAQVYQVERFNDVFRNIDGFVDWIDADKYIAATAALASTKILWESLLNQSHRHNVYLDGKLQVPSSHVLDFVKVHDPSVIAENNTSFYGLEVMLYITAALLGSEMESLGYKTNIFNSRIVTAAITISHAFDGISASPDEFIKRLVKIFSDTGYENLEENRVFKLDLGFGEEINRPECPFKGASTRNLFLTLGELFKDQEFSQRYITLISKG